MVRGAGLHGDLVLQAVRRRPLVQHVEQPQRVVLLSPAVSVVALVRVGLVLRGDARFAEFQEFQAAEQLVPWGGGGGLARSPLLLGGARKEAETLELYQAAVRT